VSWCNLLASNTDSPSVKLTEYLAKKLLGSSVEVSRVSDTEIQVRAGDDISVKIFVDSGNRALSFNLFSPTLNRIVTYEEIDGTDLLDVRLDDELKSSNHEAEEEDTMLAIDLLKMWGKESNYSVTHVPLVDDPWKS
jgi:hypothetical protein